MDGESAFDVIVPPGADLARIQPQLSEVDASAGVRILIKHGSAPTVSDNEISLEDRDVLSEPFAAGKHIYGLAVDTTGAATALADSYVTISYYTNVAGRATMAGV